MQTFAFISRHQPTAEQYELAQQQNILLQPVGDLDAFGTMEEWEAAVPDLMKYDGVVVVHPVIALMLFREGIPVGVFKNENRAPVGEKPTFLASELRVVHWL